MTIEPGGTRRLRYSFTHLHENDEERMTHLSYDVTLHNHTVQLDYEQGTVRDVKCEFRTEGETNVIVIEANKNIPALVDGSIVLGSETWSA